MSVESVAPAEAEDRVMKRFLYSQERRIVGEVCSIGKYYYNFL
ncbi:MAG: hypothetical protein N2319_10750 [Candidatus Kapabacteria bacterium]|nr:hypothetical protein [Candidatus Kapabacteria bacterium]